MTGLLAGVDVAMQVRSRWRRRVARSRRDATPPLAAPGDVRGTGLVVLALAVITIVKTRQGDWFSFR